MPHKHAGGQYRVQIIQFSPFAAAARSVSRSEAALGALIGSRICHDLISPIGAINNGIELLAMTGGPQGPETELIGESVSHASARIRFFRLAFGAAGEQMVGRDEVEAILRDTYGTGRLKVNWDAGPAQPRSAVRLAFLGLLCLESALPFGGEIVISAEDGDWALKGSASKLIHDPAVWSLLGGEDSDDALAPSMVQFALAPAVAKETGRRIETHVGSEDITITF